MSGLYWFLKHFLVFVAFLVTAFLVSISIMDTNAGLFSKDKIPYNALVSDTIVVEIPDSKYMVIVMDDVEYIHITKKFKNFVMSEAIERKTKPTPLPTKIPYEDINKPKE